MGLGKIPFERNGPAVARRRLVRPCELLEYVAPIEMSERVPAVHREGPVVALAVDDGEAAQVLLGFEAPAAIIARIEFDLAHDFVL